MDKELERIYEGPLGFGSEQQLYREAKKAGLAVSHRDVRNFVSKYKSETLFRRRKRRHVQTWTAGLNHKWQLDLGFYPKYRHITSFLVCIDVLSRKCYYRALKDKTSRIVAGAFEDILEESGESPSFVVTDRGTEFVGAEFQRVLSSRAIHHYYANPPFKASLAERLIGRLKEAEGRLRQAHPDNNWPARLHTAVQAYNQSLHSATQLAPNDVNYDNAGEVYKRLYPKSKFRSEKMLKIGTPVRLVLIQRKQFEKSHAPRNSDVVYKIGRIRLHTTGVKYKLFTIDTNEPIAGTWNSSELVPISLPQR